MTKKKSREWIGETIFMGTMAVGATIGLVLTGTFTGWLLGALGGLLLYIILRLSAIIASELCNEKKNKH